MTEEHRPLRVAYAIPAYRRQVDVGHVHQAMALGATFMAKSRDYRLVGLFDTNSCSIDWSRNQILHHSMAVGADWLLTCDADTFHAALPGESPTHNTALDVLSMLNHGEQYSAAVIAAPVPMRGRHGYNVFDKGGSKLMDIELLRGKVTPVDRIGTAFMAINVGWIRDCWPKQPWFVTQQLDGDQPAKIGEDISFCDGVRARGGEILAYGLFEPKHIG
jgi:hypothetical protein